MAAGFARSWAASAVSNVGDGVAVAAGPLLLASLTSDPALKANAAAHLSLALARAPWVAVTTMVVFGAHASPWGILCVSWRRRAVPDALRGRVNSGYYYLFSMGGAAVGALGGGLVARALVVTAPFWIASAG